ncbi:MAG TPA: PepSY-associated TM helix domain-containing protein [Aridibacter sp.]|nr:PepSY-associated TM helix domain-containing protein [Aridibacter sp.]
MLESRARESVTRANLSFVGVPRTPNESVRVYFTTGSGTSVVYGNQYTGEILGASHDDSLLVEWIFAIHTGQIGGRIGETSAGICASVLLFLSLTGLYLWFPGRKNLKRGFLVSLRQNWKRTIYDLHNVVGIYASIFLLITSLTGIYFVFHEATGSLINFVTMSPPLPAPKTVNPPHLNAKRIFLDRARGFRSGAS